MDISFIDTKTIDACAAKRVMIDGVEHVYLQAKDTADEDLVVTLCGEITSKEDTSERTEVCEHCRRALALIFINSVDSRT